MLRGLWKLTWLEIKIFVREPLGLIGTVGVPVLIFVVFGRLLGPRARRALAGRAALRLGRSADPRVPADRRRAPCCRWSRSSRSTVKADPQTAEGHAAAARTPS